MYERDVSLAYPSGKSSTGSPQVVAHLAYLSATSLPVSPLCAGIRRMVTLLSLAMMREHTSVAANANRCPGPRLSSLTQVIAEVESTKGVYWRPRSCLCSMVLSAWQMAKTSASNTSLLFPRW